MSKQVQIRRPGNRILLRHYYHSLRPSRRTSAFPSAWTQLLHVLGPAAKRKAVQSALLALEAAANSDHADGLDLAWYAAWRASRQLESGR